MSHADSLASNPANGELLSRIRREARETIHDRSPTGDRPLAQLEPANVAARAGKMEEAWQIGIDRRKLLCYTILQRLGLMQDDKRESKDRRRFLKRLAIGAGLTAPVLVTLSDRKVVAQSGGPTPTTSATPPPS